jgi:hypothetical protein
MVVPPEKNSPFERFAKRAISSGCQAWQSFHGTIPVMVDWANHSLING